jgi:transposase
MAAKAIRMEQLKQIIRLKQNGFSIKAIARTTGIARNTIKKYLSRIDTDDTDKVSNKQLAGTAYDNDTEGMAELSDNLLKHIHHSGLFDSFNRSSLLLRAY